MRDINLMSPHSGRYVKEDNTTINIADLLQGMLQTVDTLKSKLAITGTIASTTVLTVNASGANFTQTGNSLHLGDSAAEFNDNSKLMIYLNGQLLEKGVDVVYVTATTLYLNITLDNTDVIMLIKNI